MRQAHKIKSLQHSKATARRLLAADDFLPEAYNPHRVTAWLLVNEHVKVVALGSYIQEAIDNAIHEDLWDSLLVEPEVEEEYSANGWADSFLIAGNASEAFWCENLITYRWEGGEWVQL